MSDIDELVPTTHTSDENKPHVVQACLTTLGNQGRIEAGVGDKRQARKERSLYFSFISRLFAAQISLPASFSFDDSCLEISSPAAKQVDKD